MRYHDKSKNRAVELEDSKTNFLAVSDADAESLNVLTSQRVFRVLGSTNNDGVYVLEPRSDAESPVELSKALDAIRAEPGVKAVVPAGVDEDGQTRYYLPDRVVVKLADVTPSAARALLKQHGGTVARRFDAPALYEVKVPSGVDVGAFIDTLNADSHVVFAEPEFYGVGDADRPSVVVEETRPLGEGESLTGAALSWNLEKIDVAGAWQQTRGNADVVVAVVDGMPEVAHEALAAKLAVQVGDQEVFSDDRSISSHATNVSGIVAGESDVFSGVAPGLRLLPVVVNLNSQVYAERAAAVSFVASCARAGKIGDVPVSRLVLSCSWRTAGDVSVVRAALEDAVEAGVPVVCSAGNNGTSEIHYPSAYSRSGGTLGDGVIAVAATDRDDRKAEYSNYAASVDLSAPGGHGLPLDAQDVPCPEQGNAYGFAAGTSISVPHVAAVAALMLSVAPGLTSAQVKQALVGATDPIDGLNPGFERLIGSGRLNAAKAVAAVAGAQPQPSSGSDQPENGGGLPPDQQPPSADGTGPHVTITLGDGPHVVITTN